MKSQQSGHDHYHTMNENRKQLRQILRLKRQNISPQQRSHAAEQVAEQLLTHPAFQQAQHIGFYMSNDNEIDPLPLVQKAWALGKKCYLPKLNLHLKKHLSFILYHSGDPLNLNRYKIPEPLPSPDKIHPPTDLDIVLTPLVGFDEQGNRLGMGGGYYDRTFEFITPTSAKPILVGLAYEAQKVEHIPMEKWDIPMRFIVTEKQIYSKEYAK
jgi:5-formyltetrahydrofolate cyclo-ligase